MKTYLRRPYEVSTNTSSIKKATNYKNQMKFTGIKQDDNIYAIDQDSSRDAQNVYVDDNQRLSSRPSLKKVDLPINSEHLKIRTDTTKGYKEANVGDGVRVSRLNQKNGGRGRVHPDAIGTLMCSCDWGVVTDDLKVRRLTPLECERLQGFSDHWTKFGEDGRLISDSERYKFTGNAVTVPVIQHIFDNWELKE